MSSYRRMGDTGTPAYIIDFDEDERPFNIGECVKTECKNVCTLDFLKRKLPIIGWLPHYTLTFFISDILAGLTVGMTAIPQGIAYAQIAGLTAEYGLYSGFMGAFVYIIFGSCKDITIGPTAILALMSQEIVSRNGPEFAVLLCFLSGCIILLFGILNLGFLVEFISMPVTAGFTTAAAITIASSQVKGLLGIPGKSNEFLPSWISIFKNIENVSGWDALLGISTIVLLLLGKSLTKVKLRGESVWHTVFNKSIWLISVGRNAIVAILGTALAYLLSAEDGSIPFNVTGNITQGFPNFQPPPFSAEHEGRELNFFDMIEEIGPAVIVIPLISILESIAIAKAFSKGKSLDATQEMIALGLCNIGGSFVESIPVTGSFTRTAVNNASGVKTPMGGLFTGLLVLVALGLLTGAFEYIPKATLSGIIIAAMFFMVEYEIVPLLWKAKWLDLIPFTATVVVCLFAGLEFGIVSGVAVNLIILLYNTARPRIFIQSIKVLCHEILLVVPNQSLVFPSAEYFRGCVISKCIEDDSHATVVIDGRYIQYIDATVAKNLESLYIDLETRSQKLVFWNWNHKSSQVICGVNQNMTSLFKNSQSLEQLFKESSYGSLSDIGTVAILSS